MCVYFMLLSLRSKVSYGDFCLDVCLHFSFWLAVVIQALALALKQRIWLSTNIKPKMSISLTFPEPPKFKVSLWLILWLFPMMKCTSTLGELSCSRVRGEEHSDSDATAEPEGEGRDTAIYLLEWESCPKKATEQSFTSDKASIQCSTACIARNNT